MRIKLLVALLIVGFSAVSHAELFDRGDGMIYDDVLNITWLQNANAGAGSSYDDGPDTGDGQMTYGSAVAWADSLMFGGFDDWRLPSLNRNGDATVIDCQTASELACRDNELGYMFYQNLMGSFLEDLSGDQGLFTNIQDTHWSSTLSRTGGRYIFNFNNGGQGYVTGGPSSKGVWAVRWGDVPNYPEIDSTPNPSIALDFGLVTTFDTPQTQNIAVTNVGYIALNVGSVTITGSVDFTVTADTCSGVAVAPLGGTCGITVTFTPTTAGTPSAMLSIPSNDSDENPVTYSFRATVTPVEENPYVGVVESATGIFSSLIPPGSGFSGSIAIVSSPGGTSTNTADLLEVLLKITETTAGSTLFCFNYSTDCEAGELSIPITAITSLDLTFGNIGCPTNGTIDLQAFSPTFGEEILISLDLVAETFYLDGSTLGTVTGTGGLTIGTGDPSCLDSDNDTIDDSVDNCTLVENLDQRDTNGDGYGNVCDPDLDNNGIVNFGDIALWVPFFNTVTSGDADFNGDGSANFGDYALYLNYFLQPPGPSGIAP